MADYNTFVLVDCKTRKTVLVTSSASKALKPLKTGLKTEVWNNNQKVKTIYGKNEKQKVKEIRPYLQLEKDYHRKKQEEAERKNQRHGSRKKF